MKNTNNIRIFATETENNDWINIYLDFSGQFEYVMSHRANDYLYESLKNGMNVADLERNKKRLITNGSLGRTWYYHGNHSGRNKHRKGISQQLENQINHIILVVTEYIEDRNDYRDGHASYAA